MPEGPELAVSRDRLRQVITGRNITSMKIGPTGRFLKKEPIGIERITSRLETTPAKFEEVHTKGKFKWCSFSFPNDIEMWYMFCTYGMTGQWELNKSKHTAFSIMMSGPLNLFFNDPRRFGTIKFVRGKKELLKKLDSIGPCILGEEITREIFEKNLMKKPTAHIAEAFMNQRSVSGIGNYLRAEILYSCGVSPWRQVSDITPTEWDSLYNETINLAQLSYRSQGASMYTFANVNGDKGGAQFHFKAYGRDSDPEGRKIIREEDKNCRVIHWCPEVQK
jgi:DNA-formamidopyrimidine glycosylase